MRAFAFEREDYLRQALEDRGYRFIRHHLFMLIKLSSEPPDPGWPEGIIVRPFRPGDERAVYEADMEAFSDHCDSRKSRLRSGASAPFSVTTSTPLSG
jgi:hypothetical protein